MFQRFVAVPYGRMQLVDITRGPLARAVGLSELKLVTAAAASNVTIPGLPEQDADAAARPARRARREPPGRAVTDPRRRPVRVATENLADGEWHRLHPATPLLRGGLALIAILGIIIANLRERLVEIFFGGGFGRGRPDRRARRARAWCPLALLVVAVALLLFIGGLLPVVADAHLPHHERAGGGAQRHPVPHQPQGAARPHPGHQHRAAVLRAAVRRGAARDQRRGQRRQRAARLPVGRRAPTSCAATSCCSPRARKQETAAAARGPAGRPPAPSLVEQRVNELIAPELDPSLAEPASVVTMHPARLIGSTDAELGDAHLLRRWSSAASSRVAVAGEFFVLFGVDPALLRPRLVPREPHREVAAVHDRRHAGRGARRLRPALDEQRDAAARAASTRSRSARSCSGVPPTGGRSR